MVHQKELYKQAAATIATSICRDAIWKGTRCNWIGTSSEDWYGMPRGYAKALGTSFYDGTSGIAFFLLQLRRVHSNPLLDKTLRGALEQVISVEGDRQKNASDAILGFHAGLAGCAYVLHLAGELLGEERYQKAATQFIDCICNLPEETWGLDVIDGPAGAIPVLQFLYKKQPGEALRQFILRLAAYLIRKADKQTPGWSWETVPDRYHNLTGYGHGAAGFATAFAELYAFTGDEQYLQIARSVVGYEDSHFVSGQQNWPDYRRFDQEYGVEKAVAEPACSIAWCHGAPGIGLSRLRIFELTKDPQARQDAEIALQTTRKNLHLDVLGNYSLCHGLFGNAELLLYAADVFNRPQLRSEAEQVADACIQEFLDKKVPVPNGLQLPAETPDFMLGSSGIGYFFLRVLDPGMFPSVLVFRS
ncbi:lanthionine synthetase LanC family protein [Flavisolibacter nicotianae]|uniref:lanthionine synthetase LanC family protein n=1 Tax=Flavisolibacter nicotianae TaxID=2364882 RepID=UPI000EB34019|nr:lanthionine synthetase LanC family protein [Flavisolibacter nicotianae]